MSEDFTVNVPFKGSFIDRIDGVHGHTGGYVQVPDSGFTYGTLAKVKSAAKESAKAFVDTAIRNAENRERVVMMCGDGHVIIAEYNNGWGYYIADSDRSYAGSSWLSAESFTKCVEEAKRHADDSFGGIVWQNRF